MLEKKEGREIQYLQAYFIRNMMKFCSLQQKSIPGYILTKMDDDKITMIESYKDQLEKAADDKQKKRETVKDNQLSRIFESIKKTTTYPKANRLLRELGSILEKDILKGLEKKDLNAFKEILNDCKEREMDTGFGETKVKAYLRITGDNQELNPEPAEDIVRYFIVPNLMERKRLITSICENCVCEKWICEHPKTRKRIITLDTKIKNRLNKIKSDYMTGERGEEDLVKYISDVLLTLLDMRMSYEATCMSDNPLLEIHYTEDINWNEIVKGYTETYTEGTMMVSSDELNTSFMDLTLEIMADYDYAKRFQIKNDIARRRVECLLYYRLSHYLSCVWDSDYAKSEMARWYKLMLEKYQVAIYPRAILKSPVYVGKQVSIEAKCTIEANCYIGDRVRIYSELLGKIIIHEHVIIEEDCIIIGPCEIKEYTIIEKGTIVCEDVGGKRAVTSDEQREITKEEYMEHLGKK